MGKDLLSALTVPVIMLGIFGPAAGALYCLKTLHDKGAVRNYLRGLLDLRFGWKAWADSHPGIRWKHLAGVDPAGTLGRAAVENAAAICMGFSSIYYSHDTIGRRTGRAGLARIYIGSDGRASGTVVGESGAGGGLGLLAFTVIFYSGRKPNFYTVCRIHAPHYRLFMVPSLGPTGLRKRTMAGLVAHGFANAFVPLFPTLVMVQGVDQTRYWIWASLTFVIGLVTMVLRSRQSSQNTLKVAEDPTGQVS